MTSSKLVSIIIPTLNETGYIERTLNNLVRQTLYKKDQMEILIGDYKNQLNMSDDRLLKLCVKIPNVKYMPLFKKGIAYSRNEIIRSMTTSNIFMMIDADSRFSREDGAELLIRPIVDKDAHLTNCEVLFIDDTTGKLTQTQPSNFYEMSANVANILEKYTCVARSSGLTVSREAFQFVGGFREGLKLITEDWMLGWDVCFNYGIISKKFIDDVKIYSSNRRAKMWDKHGIDVLNYDSNNFR